MSSGTQLYTRKKCLPSLKTQQASCQEQDHQGHQFPKWQAVSLHVVQTPLHYYNFSDVARMHKYVKIAKSLRDHLTTNSWIAIIKLG